MLESLVSYGSDIGPLHGEGNIYWRARKEERSQVSVLRARQERPEKVGVNGKFGAGVINQREDIVIE